MAVNKWTVHLKGRVFARKVYVETVSKKQAEALALKAYDDDNYVVVRVEKNES
jgi:hypothetical protein